MGYGELWVCHFSPVHLSSPALRCYKMKTYCRTLTRSHIMSIRQRRSSNQSISHNFRVVRVISNELSRWISGNRGREQKCFQALTEGRQRRSRDHIVSVTGKARPPTQTALADEGNADQVDRRHEPGDSGMTVKFHEWPRTWALRFPGRGANASAMYI